MSFLLKVLFSGVKITLFSETIDVISMSFAALGEKSVNSAVFLTKTHINCAEKIPQKAEYPCTSCCLGKTPWLVCKEARSSTGLFRQV